MVPLRRPKVEVVSYERRKDRIEQALIVKVDRTNVFIDVGRKQENGEGRFW